MEVLEGGVVHEIDFASATSMCSIKNNLFDRDIVKFDFDNSQGTNF